MMTVHPQLLIQVGNTKNQPIEIEDQLSGLQMTVVEQGFINEISKKWEQPGVYILLGRLQSSDDYEVSVNEVFPKLRSHLLLGDKTTNWSWYRALLIQGKLSYTEKSFNIKALANDLYKLFDNADHAILRNNSISLADVTPFSVRASFIPFRDPIVRVLNLLGFSTESNNRLFSEKAEPLTSVEVEIDLSFDKEFNEIVNADLQSVSTESLQEVSQMNITEE